MNKITQQLNGKYWDQLLPAQGECIDFGWRNNVIVNQCRQLLAGFVKGDTASGIQYIALGRGDVNWDDDMPSPPDMSTDALVDIAPHTIPVGSAAMEIEFLDTAGSVSLVVTDRIQVAVTIDGASLPIVGDETFPLREFALFGNLAPDDYMIDYVRHPVIHIGTTDTLIRRVKLVF